MLLLRMRNTWQFLSFLDVEDALVYPERQSIVDYLNDMEREYPNFDALVFQMKTFQPYQTSLARYSSN